MITPIDYYKRQCDEGKIVEDAKQLVVLEQLQNIYQDLLLENNKRSNFFAFIRKPKVVRGLYFWGGVGIGKTFLLDCFFDCIPFQHKMRVHFHQFMKYIHHELKFHQGKKDPIKKIAKHIAMNNQLLCFDEFFVTDITDAMLLANLLEELFSLGVCLVATSNVAPDELYKRGLQRARFLPAIALIKTYTTVMHQSSTQDYRLQHLISAGVCFVPNDYLAQHNMENIFNIVTEGLIVTDQPLHLLGRSIHIIKQAGDVIWFDFHEICRVPRSQLDYLEIAANYTTVFISNIPVIRPQSNDLILLLIRMIDVFYDARIRLVFSSEVAIDEIYTEGRLVFEFSRTRSRLIEMQSEHYFSDRFSKQL